MDCRLITIVAIFALFAAVFASDSVSYANSNDLKVTRTLETEKTGKIGIISGIAEYSYTSKVVLSITNTGNLAKPGVLVKAGLAGIPADAKITYEPKADSAEGTVWSLDTLKPGETKEITATVDIELGRDWLNGLAAPAISVEQSPAVLSAPAFASQGETVTVFLSTADGKPIAKAKVVAVSPKGERIEMLTDASGSAVYKVTEAGSYIYVVDTYKIESMPSTEAKALITSPPITAAVQTTPAAEAGFLSQLTLVVAGFMLVALILLAIIAYYSTRGEEEEAYKPKAKAVEEEEVSYFTPEPREPEKKQAAKPAPSDDRARLEKAKEMTRKILEARKKELAAKKAKKR